MLKVSISSSFAQIRGVRTLISLNYKAPWKMNFPNSKGWRVLGPIIDEKKDWADEWDFSPLHPHPNEHPFLKDYYGTQPAGYTDSKTGKFVEIPEMIAELVVPDLKDFTLKPYVSYRSREISDEAEGAEQLTAQQLFDQVYRPTVESAFKGGKYDNQASILQSDEPLTTDRTVQ